MTNETLVIGNEVATTFVEGKAGVGIEALQAGTQVAKLQKEAKSEKGSNFDIDEKPAKAKPTIHGIHLGFVEYVNINGIRVSLEEGRTLIERIKRGEKLSYEIDDVEVYTDCYNYIIKFANSTIKAADGTEKEHQVFYTRACVNFEIVDGKIVTPEIINPERVVALVRKNKIKTSISHERLLEAIEGKSYVTSDIQVVGNDEYVYHAGTGQFIVLEDSFDNVFFPKKKKNFKQNAGDGAYVPKVADYAIHLIENGQYKVRYGKQTSPGGKVVYTGTGTRNEAERSYENFVSSIVVEDTKK